MSLAPVEILGLFAGFFTAFATVPQTLKIIRLKQADAVSTGTFSMFVASYFLWLIYGIMAGAISLIFWNAIALVLGSLVLSLKVFVWNEK